MSKRHIKQDMETELAQLQRGIAVLECIRFVTLYENEQEIDLDAALTVAMDVIKKASFRLDAITTKLPSHVRREASDA